MIPTDIHPRDTATSHDAGEARLETCEALRDSILASGVSLPPDLLAVIERQSIRLMFDEALDVEALAEAEEQLQAFLSEGSEPEEEIATADGDKPGNGDPLSVIRSQIVELFHDRDHKPYASVRAGGATQVHAVESGAFRMWLASTAYKARALYTPGATLDGYVENLAAQAQFDGAEHQVFVRIGEHAGAVYIDLGSDDWSAVKLEAGLWSVVPEPPVKFRRPTSAQALPTPRRGGSIDLLWKYANVEDTDRLVVLAWLLVALGSRGPYPILAIQGEQGTAKSSTARVLKSLTDPCTAPLRSMPPNEMELANAASNAHVLVMDNVSKLTPHMSDAFCRLSTGGGINKRKLYTDSEEIVLDIQVPVIMTSITDVITRPDLADRTYFVRPPYIEPADRRSERDLEREFEQDAPLIFGALLDALAMALDRVDGVTLSESPRLADAARLAEAGAASFGLAVGVMEQALLASEKHLDDIQLESVPFSRPLVAMSKEQDWDLTMSELLAALGERASDEESVDASWPRTTKKLAQDLQRLSPVFRRQGIEITRYQTPGSNSQRIVRIRRNGR